MITTIMTQIMMAITRRQEHGGVELDRASDRSKNRGGVDCQLYPSFHEGTFDRNEEDDVDLKLGAGECP